MGNLESDGIPSQDLECEYSNAFSFQQKDDCSEAARFQR